MMNDKKVIKQRTQKLRELRTAHQQTVDQTQQLVKEQRKAERLICIQIREKSKTVPEISKALDLPTDQVLWFLTAMRKYGIVKEDGMCGEYVLYTRNEE